VDQGITRRFFPHGLGHFLGLQVHDVGGFQADRDGTLIPRPEKDPFLRLTRRLEADHVTTIEPGLYFIEPLLAELRESAAGRDVDWAKVDALRPCGGIRVEDNVRVLDGGHENLTREAFAAT
jgi:Xaa-Pro dipeptidase